MRKKIVAGNWKMNKTLPEAEALVSELLAQADIVPGSPEVLVAPSFVNLQAVAAKINGSSIRLCAQNCSAETSGAFTGEVSADMLKAVGVSHVIIGHSERRTLFLETNDLLQRKLRTVLKSGLIPIYCIGETLSDREGGRQLGVVEEQLKGLFSGLESAAASSIVLAYEPVWAIGTGKTATSAQAQEMHAHIRSCVKRDAGAQVAAAIRILYGGSCNPSNAAELFSQPDVDGGLIGGASLKAADFASIIKAAK